jgi:hypothetical protein
MEARKVLNVTSPSSGGVVLTRMNTAYMRTTGIWFLGASFPVVAVPGQRVDSLSIVAPEDGTGLLMLRVTYSQHKGNTGWEEGNVNLMLKVTAQGETKDTFIWLDPGQEWRPVRGGGKELRQGTLVRGAGEQAAVLLVQVGDIFYSSSLSDRDRAGFRYVPDVNLLCKYLSAQAEVSDLEAAAVAAAEEQDIRQALAVLQLKTADQESEILRLRTQQENDSRKILDLSRRLNDALARAKAWYIIATAIRRAASLWWWRRGEALSKAGADADAQTLRDIEAGH